MLIVGEIFELEDVALLEIGIYPNLLLSKAISDTKPFTTFISREKEMRMNLCEENTNKSK